MSQYAPLSVTDICNLALFELGIQPIDDIDQTNGTAAGVLRTAYWQCLREIGRSHPWNCLRKATSLTALVVPGLAGSASSCYEAFGWPGCRPSTLPPYWAANTYYAGGTLVTWGEAIYYSLYNQTSGTNFVQDMTNGLWAQIYSTFISWGGATGGLYPWSFAYALPNDFLLLNVLNENDCWGRYGNQGVGDLYEIYVNQTTNQDQTISSVSALFTDEPYANIEYTALVQDPTVYDPMFISALALLVASKVATVLLGDDGKQAAALRQRYLLDALPNAKMRSAGERKVPRYDPTRESNFLRARWRSTNG